MDDKSWLERQSRLILADTLKKIKWKSVDKDNMEFEAKITCYQKDLLDAFINETT